MEQDVPASLRVVAAVADAKGVEPEMLEPPLYDVVDTDALDALVRHSVRDGFEGFDALEFVYASYTVLVDGDGDVRVTDLSRDANASQTGEVVGQ